MERLNNGKDRLFVAKVKEKIFHNHEDTVRLLSLCGGG